MKKTISILFLFLYIAIPVFAFVPSSPIFLVGEQHGVEEIYEREHELWKECYDGGMRTLFTELPYYTAEFLNEWMQSDDDSILNAVYDDWEHTAIHIPETLDYYKWYKEHTPETRFIGTDVGHQGNTTGARYLKTLEERGLKGSEEYRIAKENIEQGKRFYAKNDSTFREKAMAENFIREYSKIEGEKIMGIYGSAHTSLIKSGGIKCPTMASQIIDKFGKIVETADLSQLGQTAKVLYTTTVNFNGKQYTASCYGEYDISYINGYKTRTFYKLENAFADLGRIKTRGNYLPYNNYPFEVTEKEVYLVVYKMADGREKAEYHISNNYVWQGKPTTKELVIK